MHALLLAVALTSLIFALSRFFLTTKSPQSESIPRRLRGSSSVKCCYYRSYTPWASTILSYSMLLNGTLHKKKSSNHWAHGACAFTLASRYTLSRTCFPRTHKHPSCLALRRPSGSVKDIRTCICARKGRRRSAGKCKMAAAVLLRALPTLDGVVFNGFVPEICKNQWIRSSFGVKDRFMG